MRGRWEVSERMCVMAYASRMWGDSAAVRLVVLVRVEGGERGGRGDRLAEVEVWVDFVELVGGGATGAGVGHGCSGWYLSARRGVSGGSGWLLGCWPVLAVLGSTRESAGC